MKTLFMNRKPVDGPWGGGNLFYKAISENANVFGFRVIYELEANIDVILMCDPRPGNTNVSINEIASYKKLYPNTKVVHRVNECDARKGTHGVDEMLQKSSAIVDDTIFVSHWIRKYHVDSSEGLYKGGRHYVIVNGVDKSHFYKSSSTSNKIRLVTHHWSNNILKGFDIYNKIDNFVGKNDQYTFTYIGRDQGTFKNTEVVAPLFGKELGACLSKHDVYISGSRYDPGPNHILEALACSIPTYSHADGGGAAEFAGDIHTYTDILSLLKKKEFKRNSYMPCSWETCCKLYFDVFSKPKVRFWYKNV